MPKSKDEDWDEMEALACFSDGLPNDDYARVWRWYQKLRDDGKLRKRDIGLVNNLVQAAYLAGRAALCQEQENNLV